MSPSKAKKSQLLRLPLPVFHPDFMSEAAAAVGDKALHTAMDNSVTKKDYGRRATMAELPDPDGLRELAGQIKRFTLDHLDYYLELLERNIIANGGKVHFAADNTEANLLVAQIARFNNCKLAVKSKSMVSEETELNHALAKQGIEVVETDLGEFILQVDNDHPTHIVMPVIHKTAPDIGRIFAKFFKTPFTDDPQELAEMARVYLRDRFNNADMGISGVNFAVAETGSIVICTNEGNGRMCTSRPKIHVAIMGMEKVIPAMDDLPVFLKLLARSASGQSLTQYTNIITGPRRPGEFDGPEQFHLIIMDNGRSKILAGDYRDTLRCIRCGACLNACPIYRKVGGRTYGSVYPGPIGALLTPLFNGMENHKHLPNASSLCGACFEACPVKINIPELLIHMKSDQNKMGITPRSQQMLFKLWAWGLRHSWSYAFGQWFQKFAMRRLKSKDGWISKMPGPARGWTQERDFPVPPTQNFRRLFNKHRRAQRKLKKSL
jgi:L-lactate dehydrogenase complex protein LldF